MRTSLKTATVFILTLLTTLELYSQKLKGKRYEIINYTTTEYKQHPQNWSAVQGKNKLMYFANNNGVLEYDGTNWRLIQLPNKSSVTSLE